MERSIDAKSFIDAKLELVNEFRELDNNGLYSKFGLGGDSALNYLTKVLMDHELGSSARSLLIYVKGWLAREGKVFDDIKDDDLVRAEFSKNLTPSSSVSRVIPLAVAANEHFEPIFNVLDLGSGRGHASQMFLAPDLLLSDFFTKYRIALAPEEMPFVPTLVSVDRYFPDFETSTQIYTGSEDKMDVFRALEERGDHNGRFIRMEADIRNLVIDDVRVAIGAIDVLILVNNVLYQVSNSVRKEIMNAVDHIAAQLRKTDWNRRVAIMAMDTWSVDHDKKPEIILPGSSKPFVEPSFVKFGESFEGMKVVAELDGSTGKPFLYTDENGVKKWMDKEGNSHLVD